MGRVKRFLTEDWAKPAWASKLETAGAAAGLLVLLGTIGSYVWRRLGGDVSSFLLVLTRQVSVPLGVVLGAPIFAMMAAAYVIKRRHLKALQSLPSPDHALSHDSGRDHEDGTVVTVAGQPRVVSAADPASAMTVPTTVLHSPQGTVGVWCFVDDPGRGIRDLKNNRYLFAQAGNGGRQATIGPTRAYIDVFALSCSPVDKTRTSLMWRFAISNSSGERETLKVDDSLSSPGWHHFTVRWDHSVPTLEFVLDARVVANSASYRRCWPTPLGALKFGSWVTGNAVHFIESQIWRVQIAPRWVTDSELATEMRRLDSSDLAKA